MSTQYSIDRAQALWTLGRLSSQELPSVGWEALELGFDGPALRRLSALDRPSNFEVRDLFHQALVEMGKPAMSKKEAAVLLSKEIAGQILSDRKAPLEGAYEIYVLALHSDFPQQIAMFGGLDQDFDIPTIREECQKLLKDSK
jgi:hypothetical protein